MTLKEFLVEKPEPIQNLLGDGLIAAGTLNLITGESGIGKTTLAVNLSLALARGEDFLGIAGPSEPVPILFLEAEGNRDRFRERVRTACASLGVSEDDLPIHFHRRGVPLDIDTEELGLMVAETGARLVIPDPLGMFFDGDENRTQDWRRCVVKPLRRLTETMGAAFLLSDHHGKPSEFRTGRHRIRGTGSKVDDADTAITVDYGKAGEGLRVLTFVKVRNGPTPEPIAVRLDLERATVEATGEDAVLALRPRLGEIKRIVSSASGEMCTGELVAAIGRELDLGKRAAEDLIHAAHYSGLISRPRRGFYGPPGLLIPDGDGVS